jgi:hypothetical protein
MAGGNNLERRVIMLMQNQLPSELSPIAQGMVAIVAIGALSISPRFAWALGQESFGPAGEHISRSGDWPKGVEPLLRHPSRVYMSWVNGNEHSYYDGDIKTVNELLERFSQIHLAEHQVIIRPGQPSARSFHGKLTPYAVEFELPGGLYLHHVREYATTGLYSAIPRLIVHVDDALAKQLAELKVPDNTSLQGSAYRAKDALAQIDAHDRSLRGRAIAVLGVSGDSSPAVVKALKQVAASDADEYIRKAAQRAMTQLQQASDPTDRALRQQVAKYLKDHPLRLRIPEPGELLEAMREVDDQYAQGFTAKGTMIEPTSSDPGRLVAWTITMGNDRLVVQRRTVEDDDHPPTSGQRESTIYVGPDRMAMTQSTRLWVDGELIDSKPHTTFEPVGSTCDLLLGRAFWPLGRGYTRRIDRITQVEAEADGTLAVMAESDEGNLMMRWEMRVDPSADYLVRSAKAFRRNQPDPMYIVDNAGTLLASGRGTAHTARWTEGISAHPVSISVTSVSAKTDAELLRKAGEGLQQ